MHTQLKSQALPTRQQEKIPTAICRVCFCAVPGDQLDTHEKWHVNRKKMNS